MLLDSLAGVACSLQDLSLTVLVSCPSELPCVDDNGEVFTPLGSACLVREVSHLRFFLTSE